MQILDENYNVIAEFEQKSVRKARMISFHTKFINRKEQKQIDIGVMEFPN